MRWAKSYVWPYELKLGAFLAPYNVSNYSLTSLLWIKILLNLYCWFKYIALGWTTQLITVNASNRKVLITRKFREFNHKGRRLRRGKNILKWNIYFHFSHNPSFIGKEGCVWIKSFSAYLLLLLSSNFLSNLFNFAD